MHEQMKAERLFFAALKRDLITAVPQIVMGSDDYASLKQRYSGGERKEVQCILRKRANKVVTYWLRKFGSKRGAPPKQDPFVFFGLKVIKDRNHWSWSQLAKQVNPKLLREKPTAHNLASAVKRAERKLKAHKDRRGP